MGDGSRSYLVVDLDSLLIGDLSDQGGRGDLVAFMSDPSEHGPVWARPPDTWPLLSPERPLRGLLADGAPLAVPGLVKRWQPKLGTCAGVGDPKPLKLRLDQSWSG